MNIDLNEMKLHWFELENGKKVDEIPKDYRGNIYYHSAIPCEFTEKIYTYNYQPIKWYEEVLLKLFPRLQNKWNITKGRTYKKVFGISTTFNGMSKVIVAMVNSGDYKLSEAIWICANSCERCMNVLSYKYLNGADGYEEYSDEWKKANTVCDFCKGE